MSKKSLKILEITYFISFSFSIEDFVEIMALCKIFDFFTLRSWTVRSMSKFLFGEVANQRNFEVVGPISLAIKKKKQTGLIPLLVFSDFSHFVLSRFNHENSS